MSPPFSAARLTVVSCLSFVQNAWLVNFNVQIASFEPHIRGAVNLMKLCLGPPTTPAHYYFSSSVSSVFAWPGPGPVPEIVTEDPECAQNMGCQSPSSITPSAVRRTADQLLRYLPLQMPVPNG